MTAFGKTVERWRRGAAHLYIGRGQIVTHRARLSNLSDIVTGAGVSQRGAAPADVGTTGVPDQMTPRAAAGARDPASRPAGWRLSRLMRKVVLAAHVIVSFGLLGLSSAMLVLGAVAATTPNPETARAAYLSMGIFTRGVIQPVAIGALATGVVLSLGTPWGLFRHAWIVAKLALTVATILCGIFVVSPTLQRALAATAIGGAPLADQSSWSAPALLVAASGANVLMLGAATAISVFKPWGTLARRGRPAREEPS